MTSVGKILLGFFLIVIVCPASIYAYNMPHEQWVSLGIISKYVFYVAIVIFLLWIASKLSETFSSSNPYDLSDAPNKTGDKFDPNSVEQLSGHVVKVKTVKGRTFLIAKGRSGKAAYQELDRHGNKIGSPVMAGSDAWKFGNDPNKALADHLISRVETVRENRADSSDGYEYYY